MEKSSEDKTQTDHSASARTRVAISFLAGILTAAVVGSNYSWQYAPLCGWDAAAIIFLVWIFFSLRNLGPEATEKLAKREEPSHAIADIMLVFASVASLVAVIALIIQAGSANDGNKILLIGLGLASVVISWVIIHTVYLLKYARLFYKNKTGIYFYSQSLPSYSDFAYVAFTIGMTFQISDNNFQTPEFRRLALKQALLSFLFGTVILASTVNFIASLGK